MKRKPEQEKRTRPGRPPLFQDGALINTHISLTAEQREWLDRQQCSASETIRRLLDREMERHP